MAGQPTPRKHPPSPNGAPTLTPLGHYAGRPDIAISRQVTVVGNKAGSRLHLASSTVSQSHAIIVNSTRGAYVRDLASRTHVYINGKDRREAALKDGDLLQIGKFKFQYNAGLPGVSVHGETDGHGPAPEALLNVEGGEMPLAIESRSVLIGRRPTCDIPLIEESVSTAHAILFEMNGRRYIRDLGSRTGTYVNGRKIDQQAELKLGDTIRIGDTNIEYASTTGEVAERSDLDEMDHLVSTAPLGTAALEPPTLEDSAHGTAHADDAIPMSESKHGEQFAAFVDAPPAPRPSDEVRLDTDPDVSGGPGDTAMLPPQAPEKARKTPTLKIPAAEEAEPAVPTGEFLEEIDAPKAPAAEAAEAAVVDDALGLTAESRRREAAKIDELSGSRRGWRGMQADESVIPAADRPTRVEPVAPIAPVPPVEPPLAASRIETPELIDEAPPSAPPQAEEEAGEPLETVEPFAEAASVAEAAPVETDDAALEVELEAPRAPEPPPAPHVTIGEEAEAPVDTLPAETFEVEVEEPAPLASHEAPLDVEEELHLPPVMDDIVEELELEPLPLTPEQGAPLDLSIEEPSAAEEPAPSLDLREPEPEAPAREAPAPAVAAEPPLAASRIEPPALADEASPSATPQAEEGFAPIPAAEVAPVTPEPEPEPIAEAPAPEPEPVAPVPETEAKSKRKRAPRKKKGAAEPIAETRATPMAPAPIVVPEPVAEAPEPEPIAPEPEPVAEAPREAVEIVEETQPTPESALDEDAVADMLAEPLAADDAVESPAAADLTDTSFGRAVDSFVGESTGPLVEAREEEATAEAPQAEPLTDEAPLDIAAAASQDTLATGPSDAEAAAIDDLLADVLDEPPIGDEAAAIDAEIEELDLAIEEAAKDAQVTDRADEPVPAAQPPVAVSRIETVPSAAAPEAEPLDFDVPSPAKPQAAEPEPELEPEPVADLELEPVAEAPETLEPAPPEPEPVARHDEPQPPPAPPQKPAAPPRPASPGSWGANQEHFLGGMPLKLNKPVKPVGLAGNAGAAAARQGQPFMPSPPPRATRPNARTRSPWDIAATTDAPVEDLSGTIPPFAGKSAKAGQITTGFDGLAMPPVRETDVFSQMGPAAFAAGLAPPTDDEDIFSRGARMARQQPQAAQPQQPQPAAKQPSPSAPPPPAPGDVDDATKGSAGTDDGPSPADAVWTDDSAPPDTEEQPVGAGAPPPPRRNRPLPTPPVFPSAEAQPAPAKRKRRWFGFRFLLIAMLLLAGGAAGGVYGLVKKQTTVTGKLRFENFPSKTIERQALLTEQRKIVDDHAFREAARKVLAQRHPDLSPGFIADPVAYEQAAKQAGWATGQNGAFAFTYNGRDEQGDPQRVRAVMLALYDANVKNAGGSGQVRTTLANLNAKRDETERRLTDLKTKIERLGAVALQMPDRKRIEELTAEAQRLEKEHTAAARRALEIKVDVERMQAALPANPQPAGTAEAPVVDPELAKLQAELKTTNEKLAAGKAAKAKEADEAQLALDAALESFQKQVAGAQPVAKDNPQLSAYLAAAQDLQTGTRDLTEKLIRRQQEQRRRLAEMKTQLAQKFEAKRSDAWKRDPELTKLGDELAIAQRQLSAAQNGGAPKNEVADLKSHVDLLDQMIKARQTLVGDDQFYADAINQLQKLIDDQQRDIDANRKQTEAELAKMQATFAKRQPAIEQMPQEQKELAASLAKQLEDINAARRKYNVAADAVAAASDADMKQAEAAAATLSTQIDARRKGLAAQAEKAATAEQEQNRLATLKAREAELAAAQTTAAETQQALDAAQRALRAAQGTETEAREAGEQRDALQNERVIAQKELQTTLDNIELRRNEASKNPEPIAPTETDVETKVTDPRPTYALASVGGIVAVFTILMLVTGTGAGAQPDEVDPPVADLAPAPAPPERIPPTPKPQANGNGNPTLTAPNPTPAPEAQPDEPPSRIAV